VVSAAIVLLVTPVIAGLPCPAVVNGLGIDDEAEKEREATKEIALRAYQAAMREIRRDESLPDEVVEPLRTRFKSLHDQLAGTTDVQVSSEQAASLKENRPLMLAVQQRAMQSASAEVRRVQGPARAP